MTNAPMPRPMWCPLCREGLVARFKQVSTIRNTGRTVSFERREQVCPSCKIAVIVHRSVKNNKLPENLDENE